jgi:hypothetical protein
LAARTDRIKSRISQVANFKARKCLQAVSPSDWVYKIFLTCDNQIAVWFNKHEKVKKIKESGPGAYIGFGGVPSVCCLYPGTQGELAETLFEYAQVWPFAGEWVHRFLYKKFGYQLVVPPAQCGGCNTSCSLNLSPANPASGQVVTITCTVTNTDGSPTKGDAPQGTVAFYVDGSVIGTQTLPDNEPDTQNYESVSVSWTAACNPQATHTIEAVYAPSESDYAGTSCSTSVTVTGCGGVTTACCPNSLPSTLHATVSNVSGCSCLAGTYALTYQGNSTWQSSTMTLCGTANAFLSFLCNPSLEVFEFIVTCSNNTFSALAGSSNCSGVNFTFNNMTIQAPGSLCGFCNGTINVTVTT